MKNDTEIKQDSKTKLNILQKIFKNLSFFLIMLVMAPIVFIVPFILGGIWQLIIYAVSVIALVIVVFSIPIAILLFVKNEWGKNKLRGTVFLVLITLALSIIMANQHELWFFQEISFLLPESTLYLFQSLIIFAVSILYLGIIIGVSYSLGDFTLKYITVSYTDDYEGKSPSIKIITQISVTLLGLVIIAALVLVIITAEAWLSLWTYVLIGVVILYILFKISNYLCRNQDDIMMKFWDVLLINDITPPIIKQVHQYGKVFTENSLINLRSKLKNFKKRLNASIVNCIVLIILVIFPPWIGTVRRFYDGKILSEKDAGYHLIFMPPHIKRVDGYMLTSRIDGLRWIVPIIAWELIHVIIWASSHGKLDTTIKSVDAKKDDKE